MNKPYLLSFITVITIISGLTYHTLKDQDFSLKGVQQTGDVYNAWLDWVKTYGPQYSHDEIPLKFSTFKSNYLYIDDFNKQGKNFQLKINQFADLSNDEFKTLQQGELKAKKSYYPAELTNTIPASVDWRTKNAVTPVKNQGQCGSCWSFSTTGSLEGLNAIKNGKLLSFSEQQLVDCSGSYGNQGCNGGLMDDAFQYVEKYGIELESTYPYTAQDGTCQYKASEVVFKNTGYNDVTANNSNALKQAIAQQPVSVAIEADSMNFQFYSGGVFDDSSCGTNLDHGVLAVGYGTQNGSPYYIVKNSWGASWGDAGYILLAITSGPGMCGIQMQPSYPTL